MPREIRDVNNEIKKERKEDQCHILKEIVRYFYFVFYIRLIALMCKDVEVMIQFAAFFFSIFS